MYQYYSETNQKSTTSDKLIPTNRSIPCVMCGDESGNCRTNGELHLCMPLAGSTKGTKEQGYYCLGDDKSGMWSMWTTDKFEAKSNNNFFEATAKIKADKARKKLEQEKKVAATLTPEQRDTGYREMVTHFENKYITDFHQQKMVEDLQRRGFTEEEIKDSGFVPVSHKFGFTREIVGCIPRVHLPGIRPDGRVNIKGDGYLIPVKNFDGLICGYQVRLYDGNIRYVWLSGTESPLALQPYDENPLAIYHPTGKCEAIAIVEGVGAKPFLLSRRHNMLVIGAAGGQWLTSEKLLLETLQKAFEQYGDELPINYYPDAGWNQNEHVTNKSIKLLELLEKCSDKVQIADWNQLDKLSGDIDEIDRDVRYLSGKGFGKKYKEVIEGGKRHQHWAKSRKSVIAEINQMNKYLIIPEGIENDCDILIIRSPLGTGKTQAFIDFLKRILNIGLLIGYRNTLLHQSIARANELGLPAMHIQNTIESTKSTQTDTKSIDFRYDDSIRLFGGCADSFQKLDVVMQRNPLYTVIVDEICSVLAHLKGAGTLKGRQKKAIEWFESAVNGSNFALLMDANICDVDVEFLRKVFPNKRIKVLDNQSRITPRKFYFVETKHDVEDYSGNADYLPSHLLELAKKNNKILWASDSQKSCEIIDETFTKLGKKVLRVDSKTRGDKLVKLFLENPAKFIREENIDIVCYSPSAESGLSIDLYGYFDIVCMDIKGVVSINTLIQMSARLRDKTVPVYVACPEFSNQDINLCPYGENQFEAVLKARLEVSLAQAIKADKDLSATEITEAFLGDFLEKSKNDEWFKQSLLDAKNLKYEHSNLRLCFKTALAQDGNHVIDLVFEKNEVDKEELKASKKIVEFRTAEKIFNSPDIEYEKAQELSKKDVIYDVQVQIEKANYKHQMPGIENTASWSPELIHVLKDKEQKFLTQYWDYQQLINPELAIAQYKISNQFRFKNNFQPIDFWKDKTNLVVASKALGIDKLIGTHFNSKTPLVRQIVDTYFNPKSGFYEILGVPKAKKGKDDRYYMEQIKKLVAKFGFEVKLTKKNNAERFYTTVISKEIVPFYEDISKSYEQRIERTFKEASDISLINNYNEGKKEIQIIEKIRQEASEPCDVDISYIINGQEVYEPIEGF